VSAAKTCLSDGFVQLYVEQRDEIDWRRNVIFGKRSTGCDWQQQLVWACLPPLTACLTDWRASPSTRSGY
jgi:hypothetical protein